jgi:signal transduction histidine kinase
MTSTVANKGRELRGRLHIGALALMASVAILLVLTMLFLRSYTSAIGWVRRSNDVRLHIGRTLALLVDAETAQRGYLLLGDEHMLEPYRRAKATLPGELARLIELTADDRQQQERVREIGRLSEQRFAVIEETVDLRRRRGLDAALEVVRSGRGTALMAQIRDLLDAMGSEETARMEARTTRARHRDQMLTASLVALIIFASVFMGTVLWSKNREIAERRRAAEEREKLIGALERSNRDLDQFAYVASHDLKAPLRGIANLSTWIQEDLGDNLTRDLARQMELMRVRVRRMDALIEGILNYSRAGRPTQKETVEVRRLLSDIAELLSAAKGSVQIGPGMPVIETERTPLQQVFQNLIANALKHGANADARVVVSVKDADPFYEFAVADNGPGIAPAYHEKIWGIFQTLDTKDHVEGTGIGLSIVKKIVEARGGRAWVDSAEGAGATFRFLWPKREEKTDG